MDRRKFLAYSSAGLLASGLARAASAAARPIVPGQQFASTAEGNNGLIGWDEFINRAVAGTKMLKEDRSQSGQDAYLYTIGALASRLGELPDVAPRDFGGLDPAYELNMIFRDAGAPFIVLYWTMEPGAIFPAHCHPGANVCTLCTSGRAIIRNFETVGSAPRCWESTEDEFGVIESRREVLRPGVINTITEFRNNIHRFEAGPKGVAGIDITTGYDEQPKPFSFLKIVNEVTNPNGETNYTGRWVGKDIKQAV